MKVYTLAYIAAQDRLPFTRLVRLMEIREVKPVFVINDIKHYAADDIRAALDSLEDRCDGE